MINNAYNIKDLNIEFKKDYNKEYNRFFKNISYNYQFLMGTDNIYLNVEFNKRDSMGYIKIKNSKLWLHNDKNNNLFFDTIRNQNFYYRQPSMLWFNYIGNNRFVLYKYLGYNLESIMKKTFDRLNNIIYIRYIQNNNINNIKIDWVNNMDLATQFVFDDISWNDMGWIKLNSKEKDGEIMSMQ